MTMKVSTGLRNYMLDTGALRAALALGYIDIYSGAVPATADEGVTLGNVLCRISTGGTVTGLDLSLSAVDGVLSKDPLATWSGTCSASGVATFYRYVSPTDTGSLSTTEPRIQGNIALAGGDMNLTNTALTINAVQTLDTYNIALPTL